MIAEKFQIYSVKITGKKLNLFIFKSPQAKLSPWLSLAPRQKKITHLSQQRFLKTTFPQQKEGIMELEKLPKLNLQGYLPQVLMNSTIFTIFKFSVSVLLCHNLASTMLKCGGSLTQLIKFPLKNIVYRNNYMKYTTFLYPIFLPSRPSYAKLNIYPYIFPILKSFIPLFY